MNQPTDEQIRKRAHQLWELAGQPEGREHEFWYKQSASLIRTVTAGTCLPVVGHGRR
jgi:hypothetical protein